MGRNLVCGHFSFLVAFHREWFNNRLSSLKYLSIYIYPSIPWFLSDSSRFLNALFIALFDSSPIQLDLQKQASVGLSKLMVHPFFCEFSLRISIRYWYLDCYILRLCSRRPVVLHG